MPDSGRNVIASTSISRHLARGALGFGLLASALALGPRIGPAALTLAIAGLLALRGCPMCWTVGLIETISSRSRCGCGKGGCTPRSTARAETKNGGRL